MDQGARHDRGGRVPSAQLRADEVERARQQDVRGRLGLATEQRGAEAFSRRFRLLRQRLPGHRQAAWSDAAPCDKEERSELRAAVELLPEAGQLRASLAEPFRRAVREAGARRNGLQHDRRVARIPFEMSLEKWSKKRDSGQVGIVRYSSAGYAQGVLVLRVLQQGRY